MMSNTLDDEALRDRYIDCSMFLNTEAGLLDERRFTEWLELLSEDIEYTIPIRSHLEQNADHFSDESFLFHEDKSSIESRVDRMESDFAWSEQLPSRTRRFVSNVRFEDVTERETELSSNLLLFHSHGDTTEYDIISAERKDALSHDEDAMKLTERTVYLDHTIVGLDFLTTFL